MPVCRCIRPTPSWAWWLLAAAVEAAPGTTECSVITSALPLIPLPHCTWPRLCVPMPLCPGIRPTPSWAWWVVAAAVEAAPGTTECSVITSAWWYWSPVPTARGHASVSPCLYAPASDRLPLGPDESSSLQSSLPQVPRSLACLHQRWHWSLIPTACSSRVLSPHLHQAASDPLILTGLMSTSLDTLASSTSCSYRIPHTRNESCVFSPRPTRLLHHQGCSAVWTRCCRHQGFASKKLSWLKNKFD